MRVQNGRAHLGYCTSIHQVDAWGDVSAALRHHLPLVKAEVSPDAPMGIGLRLSAAAAETLRQPEALASFQRFLGDAGCYVFTINGFPYGGFYEQAMKAQVYQPDWRHPARLAYTNHLADLLVSLLSPPPQFGGHNVDGPGSISTVPGGFRPDIRTPADVDGIVDHLVQHAAHLHRLHEQTGRVVSLAIEPEPHCYLETTEEAVRFFDEQLFGERAVRSLAEATGLPQHRSAEALARHLGLCIDTCHAAVEFEDADDLFDLLRKRGVQAKKIQLSAGLRSRGVTQQTCERLKSFDDGVYLHQVVAKRGQRLDRYLDLSDALASWTEADAQAEWRMHFHVPIFEAELDGFDSTRSVTEAIVAEQRKDPLSPHLEVETYTWAVLPPALRKDRLEQSIARELLWAAGHLGDARP